MLDTQGEPVLIGAEGEIYIRGAGVARGYLNRSERTAERFLLDPFSDVQAARMHRTGDLARFLPDGNLVFLGGTDQQIKIRSFQIKLREIEACLVQHPNVDAAAVQSFADGSEKSLVAYVVVNKETFSTQNLRIYLSTLLPDHMVPVTYVCLSSLPLTPNGKLDQRELPDPADEPKNKLPTSGVSC